MTDFKFPATLTSGSGVASVTAFNINSDSPIYQANEYHPNWDGILAGLRAGDENVWELFDIVTGMMARFNQVTERVSWNGAEVMFDGNPIHSVLADQLTRALQSGDSDAYVALAKFWEKLESNPNEHSRTQAYDWLACHKFQITADGDVVGYKYVNFHEGSSGKTYESAAKSYVRGKPSGYVNGVPVPELSSIPQDIGDVVTMPRNQVAHDPTQACEAGLHVGTFEYVGGGRTWRPVLRVFVNPRDIVSVPTDGSGAKVRVNRYVVDSLAPKTQPSEAPVLRGGTNWEPDVSYRG